MSQLKEGYKNKVYSEDKMLRSMQKELDHKHRRNKFYVAIAAFAVALLLFVGTSEIKQTPLVQSVYAKVSVDINPSIELTVGLDDQGNEIVIDVYSYNADAEGMDLESLKGKTVDEAIDMFIKMAEDLGFIVTDDAQLDYVVIATNVAGDGDASLQLGEELSTQLQERLKEALSVVYFVASDEEAKDARDQNQSMGITILNGLLQTKDGTPLLNENSEPLTVKEFVLSSSNLTALTERAIVVSEQDQHMTNLIARFLEEMYKYEGDLNNYTEELNNATDLVKLKTVMAKIRSELHVEAVQSDKATADEKASDKLAQVEARAEAAAIRAAQKEATAQERADKKTGTD